jgi:hypothetical protein
MYFQQLGLIQHFKVETYFTKFTDNNNDTKYVINELYLPEI